jgi:hypothetical protein
VNYYQNWAKMKEAKKKKLQNEEKKKEKKAIFFSSKKKHFPEKLSHITTKSVNIVSTMFKCYRSRHNSVISDIDTNYYQNFNSIHS